MDQIESLFNSALAHHQALRVAEAESAYRRVLELDAGHVVANYNLGIVLRATGRREEALACFKRAAELDAGNANLQYGLGHILCDEDRQEEAAAAFRRALALRPDFAEARWSLALLTLPSVATSAGEAEQARRAFDAELAGLEGWYANRAVSDPAAIAIVPPFNLAYQEAPNRDLLARYGRLASTLMHRWTEAAKVALPVAAARASRKVRVGVVSSHFHHHSVWQAIVKGWYEQISPERVELHSFYIGTAEDAQTRIAYERSASFAAGQRGVREWVKEIGDRTLDVLIYPELGMETLTYQLACLRLAPRQAVCWGHPETSGIPTIDAFLSADLMEPAEAQSAYSERLVRLPNLGCYFEPRGEAQAVDPSAAAIDDSVPLLVCPGVPYKYAPQNDWVFPAIAKRLGKCRMVFFAFGAEGPWARLRKRLAQAFETQGLRFEDYVSVLPWQSNAAFLGWLTRADVFLDTIGFSGFNTASQALQFGLPVATREGRFLRGRLASGPLKRIGVPELVAADEAAYVELAVRLVQDADFSEAIRARIGAGCDRLFRDLEPIRALERFLLEPA